MLVGPSNTIDVLQACCLLPRFVALLVARLLGFFDGRLYNDDVEVVGVGGKPVLDWLTGADINWSSFTLNSYRPRSG